MNILILLVAALLPAVILWFFIWRQDPQPEPKRLLVKAVAYGAGICIPVSMLEVAIENIFGLAEPTTVIGVTLQAFFVAAIPEESFKLLVLWLILRKNPYFDEHFDGIVYAVCVGLGFAAIENVFYILAEAEDWLHVAVVRAFLAVPGHYAFAVLMGYYYSVYHFIDRRSRVAACILLVPVLSHGVYDAIALIETVEASVGGLSAIVLIYFCVKMHKFAKTKIVAQVERDKRDQNIQA